MAKNSNWPQYETAATDIKNEARKKVMAKAERKAKEFQAEKDGGKEDEQPEVAESEAEAS